MSAVFFVRIQLNGATPDDYKPLWKAAEERGFRDWAEGWQKKDPQSRNYELPRGFYRIVGDTGESVRALAEDAAATTGREFQIVVVQAAGWWGHGLEVKAT